MIALIENFTQNHCHFQKISAKWTDCKLYVFDIRHQQEISTSQPIKPQFDSGPVAPAATKSAVWSSFE